MTIEEKYRIAVETLQAITPRADVMRKDFYNEWHESNAMYDMEKAAERCLARLGDSAFLPSYSKRKRSENS